MENMKHAKKLLGLLLALAMVLSLAATAFATGEGAGAAETEATNTDVAGSGNAGGNADVGGGAGGGNADDKTQQKGTINIKNAVAGQTYKIYRILDLSYDAANKSYSYKASSKWDTFINSDDIKDTYVNVDAHGYVTWVSGADVKEFAQKAKENITSSNPAIEHDGTQKANGTAGETVTVTFDNLTLGYYLVDSSMGALCALDSTDTTVNIDEKNSKPTVTKQVYEDNKPEGLGSKNDASIGEIVKFVSVITAGKGADNYKFWDKMGTGLTFTNDGEHSLEIIWNNMNGGEGGSPKETTLTNADYNLVENTGFMPGESATPTFKIEFMPTLCAKLEEGDTLTITYYATVNENALIAGDGNPNECLVTYGDSNTQTEKASTVTYVWYVDVFKYAEVTENGATVEKPLAGAKFKLCTDAAGTQSIALFDKGGNTYRVAKGSDVSVTEITTDETGSFTIEGLDSGTYYLKETVAPGGYNLLSETVAIVIDNGGKINVTTENSQGVGEVKVLNQSGTELPSTGGIGTTIFYVLGSALLIGAVVLLVARKRMNAEK